MKLLQINSTVNSGSTGRIAEHIGRIAIENGWESYIAYGRHRNTSFSKEIQIGTKLDVYLHGIYSLLTDKHGLASINATNKFIDYVKYIKPDVIHLHNIHGYYLNYKYLFEYFAKIDTPIVWTMHDCWSITGHCSHFESVTCNKWKNLCNHCPLKTSYPRSLLLDNCNSNYLLKKKLFTKPNNINIITVSKWLEGIMKDSFLNKYPIHTIYNGVDISSFRPIPFKHLKEGLKCENKKILLGVATAWSERKGLSDYYKLAQKLPPNIQIILVGLNKKQLKEVPSNIIGIERTESIQQLAEYYSMADIVLNLSYEETFGLTTVEGFACGTPGIVYDKTASPELVSHDTGIIVEAGNIDSLVVAISAMLKQNKELYSKACRNRAINSFDIRTNYYKYIDLYKNLI